MNRLLQTGGVAILAFEVGYVTCSLSGEWRTVNSETAMAWVRGHDAGCDEILVNEVLGKPYCVVGLDSEDDAVYIIRKEGAHDDYETAFHSR